MSPINQTKREQSYRSAYDRKKVASLKSNDDPVDEVFSGFKQRMRKERDKKLELGLDAADLKSPKNKGLMSSIKQLDEQAETDK